MSTPWLFLPEIPVSAPSTCCVNADEARHATASRRLRAGDAIHIFDGKGRVADALLSVPNNNGSLDVSVIAVNTRARAVPDVEIASAIPKGDRLTTLLESIAPLAASRWTPLRCTHSVVTWSPSNEMRSARVLIAACKQSQQPWLPVVAAEASPIQVTRDAIARGRRVFIAHTSGGSVSALRSGPCGAAASAITVLIGPEGGFTTEEVEAVKALAAECISLGSAVLRMELAVAAALACCRL